MKIEDWKLESFVFVKINLKAFNNHMKFETCSGQERVFFLLIDDFEDQKDDSEKFCLFEGYIKLWGVVSRG